MTRSYLKNRIVATSDFKYLGFPKNSLFTASPFRGGNRILATQLIPSSKVIRRTMLKWPTEKRSANAQDMPSRRWEDFVRRTFQLIAPKAVVARSCNSSSESHSLAPFQEWLPIKVLGASLVSMTKEMTKAQENVPTKHSGSVVEGLQTSTEGWIVQALLESRFESRIFLTQISTKGYLTTSQALSAEPYLWRETGRPCDVAGNLAG